MSRKANVGKCVMAGVVLLFCLFFIAEVGAEEFVLVDISGVSAEHLTMIREAGGSVSLLGTDRAVALLSESELPGLAKSGLTCKVIDSANEERKYLLVLLSPHNRDEDLRPLGDVLARDGDRVIVRTDSDGPLAAPAPGLRLLKALQISRPVPTSRMKEMAASPLTDEITSQVSPVRIHGFISELQDFQTRFAYAEGCSLAANYLIDEFESWGLEVTEHRFANSAWIWPPDQERNIIATIPGITKPDEIVAICAHYDSYSEVDPWNFAPGADDNASGTAAVLETARILSQYASERTIRFICFGGEEEWMIGSYAYVKDCRRDGDNFVAVINNDMIAFTNNEQEDVEVDCIPETEWLADQVIALAAGLVTYPLSKNVDWGNVSDHLPFWENGYAALELAEDEADEIWGGASPWYHTPGDVIGTLNLDFATQVVQLNAAALAVLAGVRTSGSSVAVASHRVDDDQSGASRGNGNGYLDPGETIELEISLQNYGDQDLHGIEASLRIDDTYVSALTGAIAFGDIVAGGSAPGENPMVLTISQSCPSDHNILLALDISDDEGGSWEAGLVLKVLLPAFIFQSQTFHEVNGDGDGKVEAGELVNIFVSIENMGERDGSDVIGHIETADPEVRIIDDESAFPSAPIGSMISNNSDPFTCEIDDEATAHSVLFTIHLTEGSGVYQTHFSFRLLVGQGRVLLVSDDGDVNNSEYYLSVLSSLGIPYDLLDADARAKTVADTLDAYDEVIWFTGPVGENTLTEDDQSQLSQFLDGGGRLLLSGCLIGYDIGGSPFFRQYLHAKHVGFPTLLHTLKVQSLNPAVKGTQFALAKSGENGQSFMAEMDPVSPAVSVLTYDRATIEGPGIIRSSGSGAIAVETSSYKIVFLSFGLEGVVPQEDRSDIVQDVLAWFKEPGVDKGDVNGDGTINVIDVVKAVNTILGSYQPNEGERARTDMNYDDGIDILDAIVIVNAILGG